MAFGDVVQSNTGTATAATVTPTLPSAVTAGSLVVLTFAADDYNATPPAGWTQSTGMEQQTFHGGYLWWLIATAAQTIPNYTIGSAVRSTWHLVEYAGPFDGSPYDVSNGQFQQTSTNSYTTPTITPTAGSRLLVAGMNFQHASSDLGVPGTWLSSFAQVTSTAFNGGNPRLAIGQARRALTADGSTGYSTGATLDTAQVAQSKSGLIIAFKAGAGGALVAADSAVAVSCDSGALTQHQILAAADSLVAVTADTAVVVQHHALVADDSTCTMSSDSAVLVQHHMLSAADSLVAVTSDTAALTQHQVLTGSDSLVTVSCDTATLTAAGQLTAADSLIAVTCTTAVLVQHQVLAAADSTVAVTSTTGTLTAHDGAVLVAADCTVTITSDHGTLVQHHVLVAQDSLIAVTCTTAVLPGDTVVVVSFGSPSVTTPLGPVAVTGVALHASVSHPVGILEVSP